MVTAVGSTALASCAAIRAKIAGFEEVPYTDVRSEPIVGAPVNFIASESKGTVRLRDLAIPALEECLDAIPNPGTSRIALMLGVGHPSRPGPHRSADVLFREIERKLSVALSPHSRVIAEGSLSTVIALNEARLLLAQQAVDYCIVGGVDTYLEREQLTWLQANCRLKRPNNPDGLIPGEAACFLAVGQSQPGDGGVQIIGLALENTNHIKDVPAVRAIALSRAMSGSLKEAAVLSNQISFELTDMTGERDLGVDHAIALTRVFVDPRRGLDVWHPAMSLGATGSAAFPSLIAIVWAAASRGFAPGEYAMCVTLSDGWGKGAAVLSSR
jgi:3-oxoacyl-[acyl-carrier-protein] synthase-1